MPEGSNKVYFGLSHCAVAFQKGDGEFDTPIEIPGAVELTVEPEGEQSVFYADNVAYYTVNSNAGYTGELTMAAFPDEVIAKMLGWLIDEHGALVEDVDGVPTPFALLYEVEGDKKKRRAVLYNVTASRPSEDNSTVEDTAEVTTQVMPFTATVATVGGIRAARARIELNEEKSNQEQYDGWYTKVYVPSKAAA